MVGSIHYAQKGVKKKMDNKKHYGCCGIIRKMDFEDRHPIVSGVITLITFVIAMAIAMVII